jgi:hypothetical protein
MLLDTYRQHREIGEGIRRRDAADVEAARHDVRIVWEELPAPAIGKHRGQVGVVYVDPTSWRFVSTVRHEAAHDSILRTCGTKRPAIAGMRYENVTDAYADLFLGGLERPLSYGFDDADAAIAAAIRGGDCVGGLVRERIAVVAAMPPGEMVCTTRAMTRASNGEPLAAGTRWKIYATTDDDGTLTGKRGWQLDGTPDLFRLPLEDVEPC